MMVTSRPSLRASSFPHSAPRLIRAQCFLCRSSSSGAPLVYESEHSEQVTSDVRPSVKCSCVSAGLVFAFAVAFDALVVFPALDELGREDATDESARFFAGGVVDGIDARPFFTLGEDFGTRKSSRLTRTPGPEVSGLGVGFVFAFKLATFSDPSAVIVRLRLPKAVVVVALVGDEGGDGDDSNAKEARFRGEVREVSTGPAGSEEYDERGDEGRANAGRVVRLDP